MEGNLFILERLIKVWMFLQILRKSVQLSHFEGKINIFPAKNARINFSVKNWFYHVTTRLDFQLSELWEMLRYKKSWEECRENSSLDLDVFAQSAESKVSNTNTNTNTKSNGQRWSLTVAITDIWLTPSTQMIVSNSNSCQTYDVSCLCQDYVIRWQTQRYLGHGIKHLTLLFCHLSLWGYYGIYVMC